MKAFEPYRGVWAVGFGTPYFYKLDTGQLVLIEDEMSEVFVIEGDELKHIGYTWDDKFKNQSYEVATRKEIKAADWWDYVYNKDNYCSEEDKIDTELDEYLRIGEEIERERTTKKE